MAFPTAVNNQITDAVVEPSGKINKVSKTKKAGSTKKAGKMAKKAKEK